MSVISQDLSDDWQKAIEKFRDKKITINRVSIVGGGSINDARRLETSEGTYFAKINSAEEFPGMFDAEATGLNFLREHCKFRIPLPVATGITEEIQWILMENINSTNRKADFWEEFGRKLAEMHRQSTDYFGFESNNYLGSLVQKNDKRDTWESFFAEMRIEPQLEMAKINGHCTSEFVRLFEKMLGRIDRYFPKEPSAALHGDLWTGNFMTDSKGEAVIFDPAVYYGHREMDLGMSKLFGGFDKRFYEAYNEVYPLEPGWEDRLHIANLYPLLAHVNLFGGSYTSQVTQILRKHV